MGFNSGFKGLSTHFLDERFVVISRSHAVQI